MTDKIVTLDKNQLKEHLDTMVQGIESENHRECIKAILLNLDSLCELCKELNYNISVHFDPKIKNAKEVVMISANPRTNSEDVSASVLPLIMQSASKIDKDVLPHLLVMLDTVAKNPDATFNLTVNHEEAESNTPTQKPLH